VANDRSASESTFAEAFGGVIYICAIVMHIFGMWIAREWTASVAALARAFPAVLLTGPRQVGKTSLLRHGYPKLRYLTFDDPALARQAESQPDVFFADHAAPMILDEVQYVPSLFRHLKKVIDRDRRPGRFLLTGSQTFPLMQNVSESLAGRCGIIEMSSLSFSEVHREDAKRRDLDCLLTGGFPALYTGAFERPADFYASYVSTYLERDVRNMRGVGDLRDFDRFMRAAAIRTGQILSYADLARDVGIAPNTARAWTSVLVASGLVHLLEPYHRNVGKRLVKSPKLYFMDTGLACHLMGIDARPTLLASPLAGALWETFVVGQVVRHFQSARSKPPIWYWRTSTGDEVDLVVERGARFIAVECKLSETPGRDAAKGIAAFARDYGKGAVEQAFVACRAPHRHPIGGDVPVEASGILDLVGALPGHARTS
jgi:predicted AAA+ superfamily ATPase